MKPAHPHSSPQAASTWSGTIGSVRVAEHQIATGIAAIALQANSDQAITADNFVNGQSDLTASQNRRSNAKTKK